MPRLTAIAGAAAGQPTGLLSSGLSGQAPSRTRPIPANEDRPLAARRPSANFHPNLYLVGAMKAATTTVADYLSQSPDVFVPPIKEPNHFSGELHERGIASRHPDTAVFDLQRYLNSDPLPQRFFAFVEKHDDYLSLYRGYRDQRYALDASTTYLSSPVAAERIAEKAPDARIIILTRNPAKRAWAEFLMNQRIGTADGDYRAALERELAILRAGDLPLFERYASTGLYAEHIARFACLFGSERIFVADVADLAADPTAFNQQLWKFLDIPPVDGEMGRLNSQLLPRFGRINKALAGNSVKYAISQRTPEWLRAMLRRAVYSAKPQPMPDEFKEIFPGYLKEARRLWAEHGWG